MSSGSGRRRKKGAKSPETLARERDLARRKQVAKITPMKSLDANHFLQQYEGGYKDSSSSDSDDDKAKRVLPETDSDDSDLSDSDEDEQEGVVKPGPESKNGGGSGGGRGDGKKNGKGNQKDASDGGEWFRNGTHR